MQHLSIFILVINQIDAQNLFNNKFISCLYMFHITNKYLPLDDQGHPLYGTAVHSCGHMAGGLHKDMNI